ncbi:hypothetical protein D3C75_746190 [compost metagenome]
MHAGERGQRIGVGNLAFVDQLVQRAFQAFAGALRSAFATIKQRDANARLSGDLSNTCTHDSGANNRHPVNFTCHRSFS